MNHSPFYAVLLALVLGVGCGKKEALTKEESAKATPKTEPKVEAKKTESPKAVPPKLIADPIVEERIRKVLNKPTGELTKADLELKKLSLRARYDSDAKRRKDRLSEVPKELEKLTQLTYLELHHNQLTDVKGLEKLTQLTWLFLGSNELTNVKGLEKLTQLTNLYLSSNQLTEVKGLEKLTKLEVLHLGDNPDLTKAQIAELKKALPKCFIGSNPKK